MACKEGQFDIVEMLKGFKYQYECSKCQWTSSFRFGYLQRQNACTVIRYSRVQEWKCSSFILLLYVCSKVFIACKTQRKFLLLQMDRVAFTLDRPQSSKAGLVRVLASPKDSSNKSTPLQPPSTENNGKMSRAQTRSSINAEGEKGALSRYSTPTLF